VARQRFDLDAVSAAMSAQHALLDDAVAHMPAEAFSRPTRLGEWAVAQLVAHIGMDMSAVSRYLGGESARRAEVDAAGYALACASGAARVDERVRAMTDEARPAELRGYVHEARLAADASVAAASPTFVAPTRLGAIGLADYLATRCVEATVHALDLGAALDAAAALHDDAVAITTRVLAAALVGRAPGGSVELRVAPHVAVQCVEGPRHTRGTPPNVVECDPVTWLELATGRVDWKRAFEDGRVSASGERADLSPYLPVLA
jgi:uncharacterized protein (TIGR03083 family)